MAHSRVRGPRETPETSVRHRRTGSSSPLTGRNSSEHTRADSHAFDADFAEAIERADARARYARVSSGASLAMTPTTGSFVRRAGFEEQSSPLRQSLATPARSQANTPVQPVQQSIRGEGALHGVRLARMPVASERTPTRTATNRVPSRLSSPARAPLTERAELASRFLMAEKKNTVSFPFAAPAGSPTSTSAAASVATAASAPVSPSSPPIGRSYFSSFTVYMRGYLKEKTTCVLPGGAVTVVRGKAGVNRYFVWHSKGLSVYASADEYTRDRRPVRQMLNAWTTRQRAAMENAMNGNNSPVVTDQLADEAEDAELVMIPYTAPPKTDDSILMLLEAQRDSQLLRLLLCPPSALVNRHALPVGSTVMVLKAPDAQSAKAWLKASSLIHYARARDRRLHTDIIPMLHALLEDPNGFIMAAATTAKAAVEERKRQEEGDAAPTSANLTPPRPLAVAIPTPSQQTIRVLPASARSPRSPNIVITTGAASNAAAASSARTAPTLSISPSSSFSPSPSPSPRQFMAEDESPLPPPRFDSPPELGSARSVPLPRPAAGSHARAASGQGAGHRRNTSSESDFASTTAASSSTSPSHSRQASYSLAALGPINAGLGPSLSFGLSRSPSFGGPSPLLSPMGTRQARTVSAPSLSPAAAASASELALTTCEYYGLNGETPLYPTLPLAEVTRYALPAPPTPHAARSPLVTVDMMGPKRCGVYDLLQWILLQYPGSRHQMPLDPAPNNAVSPSMTSSPSANLSPPSTVHNNNGGADPSSSAQWSAVHIQFAFLLFRGAFLDCDQLVEWLREAWSTSSLAYSSPGALHAHHHVRANVLHMLVVWVEHFRRDYLSTKPLVDAFLRTDIYPAVMEFEEQAKSDDNTRTCAEWSDEEAAEALGDMSQHASQSESVSHPRCINLTSLAAHLSSIIALTAGSTDSVLASLMHVPAAYLPENSPPPNVATEELNFPGGVSGGAKEDTTATDADTTSTRPVLSRAVSSPLVRRQSLVRRTSLIVVPPKTPSTPAARAPPRLPPPLQSGSSFSFGGGGGVDLGSQAHRPPQCFATKLSSLVFLKKFVGFAVPRGGLLEFAPTALAAELTNIDLEALLCVHTRELAHKAWTARTQTTRAAQAGSVVNLIESFNRRSFWVASEILKAGGAQADAHARQPTTDTTAIDAAWPARVDMLVHFIALLGELYRVSNFYGCFAILTGLSLQPIYRLKKLWRALPERAKHQLDTLREGVFSSSGNFTRYRTALKKANQKRLAHIPHFAILLKDLFQFEELPTFIKTEVTSPQKADATSAPTAASSPPPASSPSPSSPSQILNWTKYAKQYAELHNAFLVSQNALQLYERVQLVKEGSEVTLEMSEKEELTRTPGEEKTRTSDGRVSPSHLHRATQLHSRTRASTAPSLSLLRPPLPPSDPSLRMCLHLQMQRVWNEDKLFQFSYRCQPKNKS